MQSAQHAGIKMNSNFRFIDPNTAIVEDTDTHSWQVNFPTDEAYKYFTQEGCTCRIIVVDADYGGIMVGGVDDCPVHGFGTDPLTTPSNGVQ